MRCPTTSGRYQCSFVLGHGGECECEASDVPTSSRIGPYRDPIAARAYLRGRLDASAAEGLDGIGRLLDIPRGVREPDVVYRERLWRPS